MQNNTSPAEGGHEDVKEDDGDGVKKKVIEVEKEKERIEETWDPMGDEHRSVLNFGFTSKYLPSAFVIGGIKAEGEYASIHEVPCKFSDGTGKCWKGAYCVRYHHIIDTDKCATPLSCVIQIQIFEEKDLPTRFAPHMLDIHFQARVVHTDSPLEFYVIAESNFGCMCGCGRPICAMPKPEYKPEVLEGEKVITYFANNMDRFMEAKKRHYQMPEYKAGQVVVVKNKVDKEGVKEFHWYRALVKKSVSYETDKPYKLYEVDVQLLDIGKNLTVPIDQVASIPQMFLNIAPIAYKCKLDGFSLKESESPNCPTSTNEIFKAMVLDKQVIIKFEPGSSYQIAPNGKVHTGFYSGFQSTYPVHMMVNEGNIQVATELEKAGCGVLHNPFTKRPWVLGRGEVSYFAACLLQATENDKSKSRFRKCSSELARVRDGQRILTRKHLGFPLSKEEMEVLKDLYSLESEGQFSSPENDMQLSPIKGMSLVSEEVAARKQMSAEGANVALAPQEVAVGKAFPPPELDAYSDSSLESLLSPIAKQFGMVSVTEEVDARKQISAEGPNVALAPQEVAVGKAFPPPELDAYSDSSLESLLSPIAKQFSMVSVTEEVDATKQISAEGPNVALALQEVAVGKAFPPPELDACSDSSLESLLSPIAKQFGMVLVTEEVDARKQISAEGANVALAPQ